MKGGSKMAKKPKIYKNYINGRWVNSKSDETFKNRNPANWDEIIGIFPKSKKEDVEDAVSAAKEAFPKWRKVPAPKRGEILRKVAELLVERKEEIAKLMTKEMGKIIKETREMTQLLMKENFIAMPPADL